MTPEERLEALGLQIPTPLTPIGNYVRCVRVGNLIFTSGHGPNVVGARRWQGKVGRDFSLEDGQAAAQCCALNLLATLKEELGELSRVRRIAKLLGMVNSAPDFTEQHKVINGASDLLVEVFGDRGRHARSAVGMGSLPNGGIPVEIEMVVEVEY